MTILLAILTIAMYLIQSSYWSARQHMHFRDIDMISYSDYFHN